MHVWAEFLLHLHCLNQQESTACGVLNALKQWIILWGNCFKWFKVVKSLISPINNPFKGRTRQTWTQQLYWWTLTETALFINRHKQTSRRPPWWCRQSQRPAGGADDLQVEADRCNNGWRWSSWALRPEVQPRDSCHKADPVVKPEAGFRSEGKAEELCGTCGEDGDKGLDVTSEERWFEGIDSTGREGREKNPWITSQKYKTSLALGGAE